MIPITLAPEPVDFEVKVRRPGSRFLRRNPSPTSQQFRGKNFWKDSLQDLRVAYNSICAYSACWIPTQGSVDHFQPKSASPHLAYEWENFRFAQEKLNNYKGKSTEVADPVHIQPGWFTLDFDSFHVVPGPSLSQAVEELISRTINILRLNRDDTFVELRFEMVRDYARGDVSMEFLRAKYPFIAVELERQGLTEAIKLAFGK